MTSWKDQAKIPDTMLQERLITVKELTAPEYESYEIAKDQLTGEHYLHYAYMHRDVAAGGAEEQFHYLLPIESDDVLGILFGDQSYTYPDHWNRAFLRNGPNGFYVWFDPAEVMEENEVNPQLPHLIEKLKQLKASKQTDPETIRKLLQEFDNL